MSKMVASIPTSGNNMGKLNFVSYESEISKKFSFVLTFDFKKSYLGINIQCL